MSVAWRELHSPRMGIRERAARRGTHGLRPEARICPPPYANTSSMAAMSCCMVAAVSFPMLEMRKVRPLILP